MKSHCLFALLPHPPSLYLRKLGAWLWSDRCLVHLVASPLVATEPLSYLTDNHKQQHSWKLRECSGFLKVAGKVDVVSICLPPPPVPRILESTQSESLTS